MWCHHPFSQRNMKTERPEEVGVRGDREVSVCASMCVCMCVCVCVCVCDKGWTKFEKRGVGNKRGSS